MRRDSSRELRERVAALEDRAAESDALAEQVASLQREIRRLHHHGDQGRLEALEESIQAAEELLGSVVPEGETIGLLAAGADATLRLPRRRVTRLDPGGRGDPPKSASARLAASLALVESARAAGVRHLLVSGRQLGGEEPGYRLREYLDSRYQLLAEDPPAGALFGVETETGKGPETIGAALDEALGGDSFVPVLDWTSLELTDRLPGRMIFGPPGPAGARLPYADDSVAVVVIDDPARVDEARRVASVATVGARGEPDGRLVAVDADVFGERLPQLSFEVLLDVGCPDGWIDHLSGALSRKRRTVIRAVEEPLAAAGASDADVAVILEPGVLPLPGCLDALGDAVAGGDTVGAATGKLLDPDGSLAGAGTMVFADGTTVGVAAGIADNAAAWHEYVRPVPAAAGLLALRPAVARTLEGDDGRLLALSAQIWGNRMELSYQPSAWAVRALEAGSADPSPGAPDPWEPALGRRPHRPIRLDPPSWRSLLARDDVAGSWQ